jgi:hypothetical protein
MLDEASTRVHAIHPSGLPLARRRPGGTGRHFGFPSGFAPRRPRAERRTPRWGQANEHEPRTTRSTSHPLILQSVVHSQRATSRRTATSIGVDARLTPLDPPGDAEAVATEQRDRVIAFPESDRPDGHELAMPSATLRSRDSRLGRRNALAGSPREVAGQTPSCLVRVATVTIAASRRSDGSRRPYCATSACVALSSAG